VFGKGVEGEIEQGDDMGEKNSLPRGGEGETLHSIMENKCPFDLIREKDLSILPKNLHLSPVYLNELLRPLKPSQGIHLVRIYP